MDSRGGVTSKREKLVAFSFVPDGVGTMKKARAGEQWSKCKPYFRSHHLALQISDTDDLTKKELVQRMLSMGGAHKPKQYDFGDGPPQSADEILGPSDFCRALFQIERSAFHS